MRRPLAAFAAAAASALLFAACGDGDDDAPAPPATGVSGTVLGQPFTPADASAVVLAAGTCSFDGVTANASGLVIGFGSFTGMCQFLSQNQACGLKANATVVNVLVVRANLLGLNPGPVQPGTYTVGGTGGTPDAQGNVTGAFAEATRTDSSCVEPPTLPDVTGTVRIDSAGARVTGRVDLTFSDGGRLTGNFDVAACGGFQADVCDAANPVCPIGPVCVP